MTKLIIQIPCFNEEKTLLTTLEALPKTVEGISEIQVLVINDGSTDNSAEIAEKWGAKVFNIKPNKGLANAFRSGLQEALNLGADIIVNTDADNQYCADDIAKLVKPILEKKADIVIGARDIFSIREFTPTKKIFQKDESKASYEIECAFELWQEIAETFGKNATVLKKDKENITVKINTIPSVIHSWVMTHINQCEIIGPKSFRDKIQNEIMDAYRKYCM